MPNPPSSNNNNEATLGDFSINFNCYQKKLSGLDKELKHVANCFACLCKRCVAVIIFGEMPVAK